MNRLLPALAVLCLGLPPAPADEPKALSFAPTDWPWWRGPNRDGLANPDQNPPVKWGDTESVLWKVPVPGRGHGSPAVVGDRIFLATATAEPEAQWLLCYDRKTGAELWRHEVHRGGVVPKGNPNAKASFASATPACDGERVFINFANGGGIHLTAVSLDGKRLWQTRVADYTLHQGYGPSPVVYGPLVLVSADTKGGTGKLAGLDRESGSIVWSRDRPKLPNYTSPIVLTAAGKDQLVVAGCNLVTSLDPLTGKENWETKGSTEECVTSAVTDGTRVFTSGGYPKNHVAAFKADGSGQLAWENRTRVYVPSMWVRGGHLYAVTDDGSAVCWKADTGAEVWKEPLGGAFTASPVPVGDRVYATNEAGKTCIFKATPAEFELLGTNKLGDEVLATPTICGGRIYMRVAFKKAGKREEVLYCLGTK
jgi:outer membrane protein assembly factor BamB